MDSDPELLEDEEEILVYVEFEGFVNNNIFTNGQLQLDMVGIDTDHPIMQIDGRVIFFFFLLIIYSFKILIEFIYLHDYSLI